MSKIYGYTKEDIYWLNKGKDGFIPKEISEWKDKESSLLYKDMKKLYNKPHILTEDSAVWFNVKPFCVAYDPKLEVKASHCYNIMKISPKEEITLGIFMKLSSDQEKAIGKHLDIVNDKKFIEAILEKQKKKLPETLPSLVCAKDTFFHGAASQLYQVNRWLNEKGTSLKDAFDRHNKSIYDIKCSYKILIAADEELDKKILANMEYGKKGLFE